MSQFGLNFRNTLPFAVDGPNEAGVVGENYPITRNGLTFGYIDGGFANVQRRDRSTGVDSRLSGFHFITGVSISRNFRWDLPSGPGDYLFRFASGDATGASTVPSRIQILDGVGGTLLLDFNPTATGLPVGSFWDATQQVLTAAAWPGGNITVPLSFTAGHLYAVIHGLATGESKVAHMGLEHVGGGSIPTHKIFPVGTPGVTSNILRIRTTSSPSPEQPLSIIRK